MDAILPSNPDFILYLIADAGRVTDSIAASIVIVFVMIVIDFCIDVTS